MTNSIASTKCLPNALSTGNYGMSQRHRYTDDSKEYIIVKLTDSAFRAIEEYQRDDHAKRLPPGQRAKIQFTGNEGVIQFPRSSSDANGHHNNPSANGNTGGDGGRKFLFTINNMEGTLECVQQQQQNLGVLGAVTLRMRIHANDDVYDTTRTKMAIAEETEKSKCIREIKPNQSDIGRKVKKPPSMVSNTSSSTYSSSSSNIANSNSGSTTTAFHHHSSNNNNNNNSGINNNNSSSNSFNSNNHSRKLGSSPFNGLGVGSSNSSSSAYASRSPNPSMLGASGTVNGTGGGSAAGSRYHHQYHGGAGAGPGAGAASSLASTFASGISQGYNLSGSSPRESTQGAAAAGSGAGQGANGRSRMPSGGNASANNKSANNKSSGGNKMSEVSRRNIRERLVHLLALKAFKKPELFARLKNEGIRDRERNQITNILMDISTMSHNTYNLRRQMWNDVDENWPFFSEQELQQLKRRKPQNLTPPMSSDAGSSTSGQSPTSTHTGSPPPPSSSGGVGGGGGPGSGAGGAGMKRTSLEYDETMFSTVQPKKQRISHYKKDTPPSSTFYPAVSSGLASSNSSRNRYTPPQRQPGPLDDHSTGDLSYNVLDNMEEFMSSTAAATQSTEQQHHQHPPRSSSSSGSGSSRRSSSSLGSGNNGSGTKDKRNSTGSNSSSSSGYETQQERQRTTTSMSSSGRNSNSSPPKLSYSFVPAAAAASSSSSSSAPAVSSSSSSGKQRSQPTTQHSSSSGSGSKKRTSQSNGVNGQRQKSSSSYQQVPPHSRSTLQQPQPHHPQQHPQQQQPQQQQPERYPPPVQREQNHYHQQANKHPSPTQQLAAAAHAYSHAAAEADSATPRYDFSQYVPIQTLEVRRRYKTEFESDYTEYCNLLKRVETVRKRFQDLSERLEGARRHENGYGDYDHIKQTIVSEYERINSDHTIQDEKQRFDYLHAKLAHIKQLVMDYDKTLMSATATVATPTPPVAAPAPAPAPEPVRERKSKSKPERIEVAAGKHHQRRQHHAVETIEAHRQQHQEPPPPPHHHHYQEQQSKQQESDSEDSSDSSDSNDEDSNDEDCDDSHSNSDEDEVQHY
ncbi:hypothetical protein KR074_006529 [Drosophila pseudoananassae]|nr:hypothetical protein KR074_006529 [Drosophila pseudoananassae]